MTYKSACLVDELLRILMAADDSTIELIWRFAVRLTRK